MGDQLVAADDQGVAGVRAAAVAGDHSRAGGQEVDDLALPLVPPLGSYYDHY